jgi:hypothetical protein
MTNAPAVTRRGLLKAGVATSVVAATAAAAARPAGAEPTAPAERFRPLQQT